MNRAETSQIPLQNRTSPIPVNNRKKCTFCKNTNFHDYFSNYSLLNNVNPIKLRIKNFRFHFRYTPQSAHLGINIDD